MQRRVSIEVNGFAHWNPIPAASRIGQHVYSGVLTGRDPQTGGMPAALDDQTANVFVHIRALMEAAGGSVDDIVKLHCWLVDPDDREALNREWLAMFPDADSRPARQVTVSQLGGDARIHCDLIAILPTT